MNMMANLRRDLKFAGGLRRLLQRIKPIRMDSPDLVCDDFEEVCDQFPDNVALEDETRKVTYRELDSLANRFGHWARGRGLRRSDVVALMMHNRIEYIAAWLGLSKVGVPCALINTNLSGAPLAHCLNLVAASQIICDAECADAIETARPMAAKTLSLWVLGLGAADETGDRRSLEAGVRGASSVRPARLVREGLTNKDVALYIYTSGTTGLPKAAKIIHARARTYMRAFAGATASTAKDRVFNVLPLYHSTGGLVGVGSTLLNGGAVIIRRKFSAGSFWADVAASGATTFVYIGELCRYLVNSPQHPDERAHKLRLAFGNGLRPEVWDEFKSRFGIREILEFYGSTEGNVSLFNFDGRAGAIGRVPWFVKRQINIRLVAFDVDTEEPVRAANGLCIPVGVGQVGEAIGLIGEDTRHSYSGYADAAASKKKVLEDVFQRGDRWFRTGDLMRQDSDGYFYFIDRVGDTFRWKGENVSTTEVQERLSAAPGVEEAVVYGVSVPGYDGKAGMAALILDGRFGAQAFADWVGQELPAYAQPVFVRILKSADTTGTFKYRKTDLIAEGFDPALAGSGLYVRGGRAGYQKLTPATHAAILEGTFRL
ncbi:long-chain-acyl-CoA synthetase [Brevundimonas balnearis]|uniref:Long-chain-acyl-CoA synthetase n=1 Tax=Brevundimonas balnearis TaxID=1572858 RepID=A0ABV6R076_9CAUL